MSLGGAKPTHAPNTWNVSVSLRERAFCKNNTLEIWILASVAEKHIFLVLPNLEYDSLFYLFNTCTV